MRFAEFGDGNGNRGASLSYQLKKVLTPSAPVLHKQDFRSFLSPYDIYYILPTNERLIVPFHATDYCKIEKLGESLGDQFEEWVEMEQFEYPP